MLRALADRLAANPLLFHTLRKIPEFNYRATKARLKGVHGQLGTAPRVLDAGCGTGEFSHLFDPGGYLGVDIDSGYVRFARKRNPSHRYECADMTTWPESVGRFDLILVNGVLHHLDDSTARLFLRSALSHADDAATCVVIEDTKLPNEGIGTGLVHYLDHGEFIRKPEDWTRLLGPLLDVERSEGFSSGLCSYFMIVGSKP
jgi:SAM-dependent methyltransferase